MKKSLVCFFALFMICPTVVFARSYLGTELPLVGKTLVPMNMQAVILGYVYAQVARDTKGCKDIMLKNTQVVKEKSNIEYNRNGREIGGTWSEEWTVNACGAEHVVPLDLTTTGHGVKYDIKSSK